MNKTSLADLLLHVGAESFIDLGSQRLDALVGLHIAEHRECLANGGSRITALTQRQVIKSKRPAVGDIIIKSGERVISFS